MKQTTLAIIMTAATLATSAQVQQGYVKTIGRPDAPGRALKGVTVRVSGDINTMVSDTKGSFSFTVKNKRFRFSHVNKKGYELADTDFLKYAFGYSPETPVVIAMVSSKTLQKEREAIEEKTRYKMTEQFKRQNAILQQKYERLQISEEQYKKQLLLLNERYDSIDVLISILSDRYARTDYDRIDSLRFEINQLIENGEMEKARQMILSKGKLDEREKDLEKARKLRMEAQFQESVLQKDLADDYYQLHEIALTQKDYVLAFEYLERRYFTDTTRVNYLTDLAYFPIMGKKLEFRQETYILKLYNHALKNGTDDMPYDKGNGSLTILETWAGEYYNFFGRYEEALAFYEQVLKHIQNEGSRNEYIPLSRMGDIHTSLHNYETALETYRKALHYCNNNENALSNRATILTKIAKTHYNMGEKEMAMTEYEEAETIYDNLCSQENTDEETMERTYILQGFLAFQQEKMGHYDEAAAYYKKATENAERCFKSSNQLHHIEALERLLWSHQELLYTKKEYRLMLFFAEKSMKYAIIYLDRRPSPHSMLIHAEAQCLMADAHACMGNTKNVECELVECLKNAEFAGDIFKDRYLRLSYGVYCAFATNFEKKKQHNMALNTINKAISILPNEQMARQRKKSILMAMGRVEKTDDNYEQDSQENKQTRWMRNLTPDMETDDPVLEYKYNHLNNFHNR